MEIESTLTGQFHQRVDDALRPKAEPKPSDTIGAAVRSFTETLRAGETAAIDGMMGKADPQSVVTAIASAELAVQSAVTIRDKVVESYQEILRMPV